VAGAATQRQIVERLTAKVQLRPDERIKARAVTFEGGGAVWLATNRRLIRCSKGLFRVAVDSTEYAAFAADALRTRISGVFHTTFKVEGGGRTLALRIKQTETLPWSEFGNRLADAVRAYHAAAAGAVAGGAGAKREPILPSLRWDVLNRDGHRCVYCGRAPGDGVKLHVDHYIPVARGGATVLSNLRTACSDCNLGKQAKLPRSALSSKDDG